MRAARTPRAWPASKPCCRRIPMRIIALFALASAALAQDDTKPAFPWNEWDAWNSFGVGSWVEFTSDGGTATTPVSPRPASAVRRAIDKKEEKQITIKLTNAGRDSDVLRKPEGDPPAPAAKKCPACSTLHIVDTKSSKEKLTFGKKEIECTLVTVVETSGKMGAPAGMGCRWTLKTWYSKEVPGWIARRESLCDPGGGWSKMIVRDFEGK